MIHRVLQRADSAVARALVDAQFTGTRYLERILEQVEIALAGDSAEYAGLIAGDRGLLVYGPLPGAVDVVKLHAIVGEADFMLDALMERRSRMIVCEVADDTLFRGMTDGLLQHGFAREGRVEGWFSDDVALDILVHRAAP